MFSIFDSVNMNGLHVDADFARWEGVLVTLTECGEYGQLLHSFVRMKKEDGLELAEYLFKECGA